MAMEKRVVFRSRWLPYALIAPQIADHARLLLLAGGAGAVSSRCCVAGRVRRQHAVRLVRQFPRPVPRPDTTSRRSRSPRSSRCSSPCSASSISLVLAVFADRVMRGAHVLQDAADLAVRGRARGRRRAVAVPVQPDARHRRATRCSAIGIDWNQLLNGDQAMIAGRDRRGVEADQLQLPVLPRRPAVDPEVADRGRGDRRRRPVAALLDDRVPAAVADDVLPARRSTSSTRSSTRSASSTRRPQGGPGKATADPGLQGLRRRLQGARPRRLGGAVGGPDGRSSSR